MPGNWATPPTFTVGETTGVTAALNTVGGNENFLDNLLYDSGEIDNSRDYFDVASISTSYVHLLGLLIARSDDTSDSTGHVKVNCSLNGDVGNNYNTSFYAIKNDSVALDGVGGFSALAIAHMSFGFCPNANAPAGAFGMCAFLLPSYHGARWKTGISFFGLQPVRAVSGTSQMASGTGYGIWKSTSAITEVQVNAAPSKFVTGSRFSLYGLY